MKNCKICHKEITEDKIYCGNTCKFSDYEYNRLRGLKKESNKENIIAECKECNKIFKDALNQSGILTKHSKTHGHVTFSPDHYEVKEIKIPDIEKYSCKICNESFINDNKFSLRFGMHLSLKHKLKMPAYIMQFPDESDITTRYLERIRLFSESDNFIECQICKLKLKKISNTHLKLHDIDIDTYKQKYGNNSIVSDRTSKLMSLIAINSNATREWTYQSKAELEIGDLLESKGLRVLRGNKQFGIELDIYLPDLNLAIEYNGNKWHSEWFGKKHKHYHLNKTEVCESNGIQLIHIFEDEWMYKRAIILNKILYKCKVNDNLIKVAARKLEIKEIDATTKNIFLEKYHIQGKDTSTIKLGAFYKDQLVAVMTFGKLRLLTGNKTSALGSYELLRYASNFEYQLQGSMSRMLHHFIKTYTPEKIITFADRRYTSIHSNVYDSNGFKLTSKGNPNYWYMEPNSIIRKHRFNYTKGRIVERLHGDINLSETENMIMMGFDRIWDCGSLKFEMKIN